MKLVHANVLVVDHERALAPEILRRHAGRTTVGMASLRLGRCHSEWVVTKGGHDDVIVGRRITPDSHEGFTFDVLILGADGHAAQVSLVDILPEARRYLG